MPSSESTSAGPDTTNDAMSDSELGDATGARPATEGRWNHNIHYGLEILDRVPSGSTDALDVGCGDGWFAREVRRRVDHVVGIDLDEGSLVAASNHAEVDGIDYLRGDFLAWPFEPASFDLITAIASLHHLDERAALRRMAELLRPGGMLAVVGLARSHTPLDLVFDLAGAVATRAHKFSRGYWETPAPKIWPPPHSYSELRRISATVLPGRRFGRRAMWRYVLTWTKPAT